MSRFDFFQAANPNLTTLDAPTFQIFNYNSDVDSFYRMDAPYQISVEHCSGMSATDVLMITNVTEEKAVDRNVPMHQYLAFNSSRALHHHEFFELMVVLEGEVINRIEEEEYRYSAGTCCLLNRNVRHAEVFCQEATLFFIDLTPEFVIELLEFYKRARFAGEMSELNDVVLRFMQKDLLHPGEKNYLFFLPLVQSNAFSEQLKQLSEQLLQTARNPVFGTSYLVRGFICSLIQFVSCESKYHITKINLESPGDFLLFLQISHLLEESNGRMSRQEIAKTCSYSGTHINRVVKKYSGMSVFDYGMTFCMKKAAMLLTQTDMTIDDIMRSLGFSNATHFYQQFKKQYRETPAKYRKGV